MSQYFIHNRTWTNMRNCKIVCTKLAHFKFDAATGLKIVALGHVYHGVVSPLLFKTVWRHLGIELWVSGGLVLEFGPFLPDIGFQLLVIFDLFFCLMMFKKFSIGERSGLQAGQFSTRTLLLRSHAVVIAAVCGFVLPCWNTQGLPWKRRRLERSICCSKIYITFQHS